MFGLFKKKSPVELHEYNCLVEYTNGEKVKFSVFAEDDGHAVSEFNRSRGFDFYLHYGDFETGYYPIIFIKISRAEDE